MEKTTIISIILASIVAVIWGGLVADEQLKIIDNFCSNVTGAYKVNVSNHDTIFIQEYWQNCNLTLLAESQSMVMR